MALSCSVALKCPAKSYPVLLTLLFPSAMICLPTTTYPKLHEALPLHHLLVCTAQASFSNSWWDAIYAAPIDWQVSAI